MYLLTINGIPIRLATYISNVIDDILDRTQDTAHNTLTGFNFIFGKRTDEDQHDELYLQALDHATSQIVMALTRLDPDLMDEATLRSCEDFPEYFHLVASIHPDHMEKCPSSFSQAMQDPVHRAQ
jgi:hypothetical protein